MMLSINNLTVRYGEKNVLDGLNLEIKEGLNVLLGLNGSGKTTLFKAINGALKPVNGTIKLDDADVAKLSSKRRATLFASVQGTHRTLNGITARALVEMAFYPRSAIIHNLTKKEKETIEETAARFGAGHLLDRLTETLSAGERQLVELVAAVCQDTPVLLLDEPSSALDFNKTHEFFSMAKPLCGNKILFATLHDPNLALAYADNVILLGDGKIAGGFNPAVADSTEIEEKLALIYTDLKVIETNRGRSVVYAPADVQ